MRYVDVFTSYETGLRNQRTGKKNIDLWPSDLEKFDSYKQIKPFTFKEFESVSSSSTASVEEIVNRNSAVRQILEVILRQLTNTRISS